MQIAPDSSGVDDARLEVVASFNLMHDNTEENFLISPGMGGDRNDMVVSLIDNEFGYGGFASVVVQVLENFIYENEPSSDNSLTFTISGGRLADFNSHRADIRQARRGCPVTTCHLTRNSSRRTACAARPEGLACGAQV